MPRAASHGIECTMTSVPAAAGKVSCFRTRPARPCSARWCPLIRSLHGLHAPPFYPGAGWRRDVRGVSTHPGLPLSPVFNARPQSRCTELTAAVAELADVGVVAWPVSGSEVRFADGRRAHRFGTRGVVTPSQLTKAIRTVPPGRLVLVVQGYITPGLAVLAERNRRVVFVDTVHHQVWIDGIHHGNRRVIGDRVGVQDVWAAHAVARTLISGGTWSTTGLVHATGLQPTTVRKALTVLGDAVVNDAPGSAAGGTANGWAVLPESMPSLVQWCVEAYPGAGGISTRWTHPETIDRQADIIRQVSGGAAVFSGAYAAARSVALPAVPVRDLLVYVPSGFNMAALGFTPTRNGGATATVVIPEDRTILHPPRAASGLGMADPLIIAHDFAQRPEPPEAARAFRTALIQQFVHANHGGWDCRR